MHPPETVPAPAPSLSSALEDRARIGRAALWALAVIFAANFLNYTDRQLVSTLEKPLIEELGLDTTEFGMLWTLFTVGYMLCAVPVGLLADRYSRTKIFAVCVVIWSLATLASGWA